MFPFKTNVNHFQTYLSSEEINLFFSNKIFKDKFFKIKSNNIFYGTVKSQSLSCYLGQFPSRNAFRPIVVINWKQNHNLTDVSYHLRLGYDVVSLFLSIPMLSFLITIQEYNIMPFLFSVVLTFILFFGIIQLLYFKSNKETFIKINNILDELKNRSNLAGASKNKLKD